MTTVARGHQLRHDDDDNDNDQKRLPDFSSLFLWRKFECRWFYTGFHSSLSQRFLAKVGLKQQCDTIARSCAVQHTAHTRVSRDTWQGTSQSKVLQTQTQTSCRHVADARFRVNVDVHACMHASYIHITEVLVSQIHEYIGYGFHTGINASLHAGMCVLGHLGSMRCQMRSMSARHLVHSSSDSLE